MPAPARAYTLVLDWLEQRLRSGEISVGDKLPSERDLAEEFGISRASVREGVRILDAMGLVRSATGSGPRSGAVIISEPSTALAWALRMHIATQSLPVWDIVQTRLLLETQSARTAAAAPESEQRQQVLERAAELLDTMDDPELPPLRFHELDSEFHTVLTSLSGNVVVETIMDSLRQATIGYVQETVAELPDWSWVRDELQVQHRAILQTFRDRDGEAAARALEHHITWFSSQRAPDAQSAEH